MLSKELKPLAKQFTDELLQTGHASDSTSFSSCLDTFFDFLDIHPYITTVSDITRTDIEEYIQYVQAVPYTATNGYRPSFVYRRLRALSHFFDYLIINEDELESEMIPKSGLLYRSDFPKPNRRGVKHLPTWFSDYVHTKILDIPKDKENIKFRTMMLFIYHTGARNYDICTTLLHAVHMKYNRPWIWIFSNKMRREYEIPITDELHEAIKEYKKILKDEIKNREKQKHPITKRKVTYLFTGNETPNSLKDCFSRTLKDFIEDVINQAESDGYDVTDIRNLHVTTHKFRHTVGINLTRMGADPLLVAEFLGHSDLSMAQAYIQEDKEYIEEVLDEIQIEGMDDYEPIILDKDELMKTNDVVSKSQIGWCIHIGGDTPCGANPYVCWQCEKLQPRDDLEYLQFLNQQEKIHQELYERNKLLGFDTALKEEEKVLARIREFQNTLN